MQVEYKSKLDGIEDIVVELLSKKVQEVSSKPEQGHRKRE